MLKLKEIIKRLPQENFDSLSEELADNKGEKFQKLLHFYRQEDLSDEMILGELDMNVNAFYTLKSRLYDRVQKKLTSELSGQSSGLIHQVAHIPELLYRTPRAVAIATLQKLEKDLLDHNLFNELIPVYAALKKLHYNVPQKFFTFSQAYNRHIAYTLALGKASDLVSDFNRTLEDFYASRNTSKVEQLGFIKQEINNHFNLNGSPHVHLYKSIVDISSTLFIPKASFSRSEQPLSETFQKVNAIFIEYTEEPSFPFLKECFDLLAFCFYVSAGLDQEASRYFDAIEGNFPALLENDHTVYTWQLLPNLLVYKYRSENTESLGDLCTALEQFNVSGLTPPQEIIRLRTVATCYFLRKQFDKAASVLQQLVNQVSFKHYPHAELEVKLLQALCLIGADKEEQALITMRSATRKVRENNLKEYDQVKTWNKLITLFCKHTSGEKAKSMTLVAQFAAENKYSEKPLSFFLDPEELVSLMHR